MQVYADYHTHTTYSHGRGSIEENVEAALKRGLEAVGIADHGPGHFFIGVCGLPALRKMQREIVRLRKKYLQIKILFGIEANIIDTDGTIDVPLQILPELDILLVGFHKLVKPRNAKALLLGAGNMMAGGCGLRPKLLRALNTRAICLAVQRYPVYAITHPGQQVDIDTAELAAVCARRGTLFEINSSYGKELDGFIKTALPAGVNFVVNSDAHTPERVGDFQEACRLIERLQVPPERVVNLRPNRL